MSLKKRSFVIPLQTKNLQFFFTDIGGTPFPLYGHLPKNLSSKRAKMVFFAQIHLFFRSKKGFGFGGVPLSPPLRTTFLAKKELRIWGVPSLPPLPFTDKIRKVVFDVFPYRPPCVCQNGINLGIWVKSRAINRKICGAASRVSKILPRPNFTKIPIECHPWNTKIWQNTNKNTDTQKGKFQQYCWSCKKNIFVQQEGENSSILHNFICLK